MLEQGLKRYFSEQQLAALANVRVGIAGAGGLGSNCAMLLVRSGVKHFVIADFDTVEPSNLNRQFYFPEDTGQAKVQALGKNLLHINPNLSLQLVNRRLNEDEVADIFKDCHLVIEALDRADYKAVLCNRLLGNNTYVISASGIGGYGGEPMQKRHFGKKLICVGDFTTQSDELTPPLAPRVMQAAALQADAALEIIFNMEFL